MNGAIEASKNKNTQPVYEKAAFKGKKILGPVFSKKNNVDKCITCNDNLGTQNAISCEFCERRLCQNCCRFCINCENNYCQLCSVVK